jgi:hypothetical protein
MQKQSDSNLIQDYQNKNKVTIALFLVFILILIMKALHFVDTVGPILNFDEFIYKRTAFQIYDPSAHITSYHYPPVYPALIGLSSFFGDSFFQVIIMINIFITTLPLFLAYWFLRKYMDRIYAFGGAVLCSAIPMNFFQPGMVMSENLYYPLSMLVCFYFILYSDKQPLSYSVGAGILFALLHLTRYITLTILPFFGLIWILDDLWHKEKRKNTTHIFSKVIICLASYLLIYSIWIYINVQAHGSFELLPKFFGWRAEDSISPVDLPLTLIGLFRFIGYYTAYFFLMIGPLIYVLIANLQIPREWTRMTSIRKFIILTFFVTAMLIFVSAWHSWRKDYNYPKTYYIMGRYISFLLPSVIVTGYIFLFKNINTLSQKIIKNKEIWLYVMHKVMAFIIGSSLIYLSYKAIYCNWFENLKDWFIMKHISPDAYAYKIYGMKLVIAVIIIMFVFLAMDLINTSIINKKFKIFKINLISILLLMNLITAGYGTKYEPNGLYDQSLKHFIETYSEDVKEIYLLGASEYYVRSGLEFWNYGEDIQLHELDDGEKIFELNNGLLLSDKYYGEKTVGKCNILNKKFYITRLPLD